MLGHGGMARKQKNNDYPQRLPATFTITQDVTWVVTISIISPWVCQWTDALMVWLLLLLLLIANRKLLLLSASERNTREIDIYRRGSVERQQKQ